MTIVPDPDTASPTEFSVLLDQPSIFPTRNIAPIIPSTTSIHFRKDEFSLREEDREL